MKNILTLIIVIFFIFITCMAACGQKATHTSKKLISGKPVSIDTLCINEMNKWVILSPIKGKIVFKQTMSGGFIIYDTLESIKILFALVDKKQKELDSTNKLFWNQFYRLNAAYEILNYLDINGYVSMQNKAKFNKALKHFFQLHPKELRRLRRQNSKPKKSTLT